MYALSMATISPFEYMLGASMKLSFVAAEVNLTSQGTFSFADMTVCTLMPPVKRLYAPFTAMITAHFNIFLAVYIPTVRKKYYFCTSYLFVL